MGELAWPMILMGLLPLVEAKADPLVKNIDIVKIFMRIGFLDMPFKKTQDSKGTNI